MRFSLDRTFGNGWDLEDPPEANGVSDGRTFKQHHHGREDSVEADPAPAYVICRWASARLIWPGSSRPGRVPRGVDTHSYARAEW